MTREIQPRPDPAERLAPLPPSPEAVVVTASYAPDLERCRLLCDTMDEYVTGATRHLILVEGRDVRKFRALAGPRREIVDERDILPSWLHAVSDPFSARHRRVWLSWKTLPLRGWHVQQLRRIAVAGIAREDHLVFCDSDVAFIKPFDCSVFAGSGRTRLFRVDGGLDVERPFQAQWWDSAGEMLGIRRSARHHDNYVTTLIAWRREAVEMMCRRIERVTGRHWVAALGANRKFSECLLYGRFVAEVMEGEGHDFDAEGFCRVRWGGEPMNDRDFAAYLAGLAPHQAAVCMQSFIGMDPERMRRFVLAGRTAGRLAAA